MSTSSRSLVNLLLFENYGINLDKKKKKNNKNVLNILINSVKNANKSQAVNHINKKAFFKDAKKKSKLIKENEKFKKLINHKIIIKHKNCNNLNDDEVKYLENIVSSNIKKLKCLSGTNDDLENNSLKTLKNNILSTFSNTKNEKTKVQSILNSNKTSICDFASDSDSDNSFS